VRGIAAARLRPALSLPARATLLEYVDDLRATGVRVHPGSDGTYWAAFRDRVVRRLPTFHEATPDPAEVDRALRSTGALIASYLAEPDTQHAANAWLYLCEDHDYSLATRAPAMQRNVRRALRDLTIAPLTVTELLAHGGPAFCDTRRRNGLDDGTLIRFRRYFAYRINRPGRAFLGAWRDGQLAAFLTIVHVDDWAELGCFSMSSMLGYRPNDALMYAVLTEYLAGRRCRVVSYGLSSIQARTSAAGLHRFKRKVGFHPSRVHRAFVLHPALRPFANRLTLRLAHRAVNGVLRIRPRDRRLKKLGGMLACMLGATWMMRAAEPGRPLAHGDPLCTT
jgi:hypothetical protein